MEVTSDILQVEIKKLFQKYYLVDIAESSFDNHLVYNEALAVFKFDFQRYFQEFEMTLERIYSRLELVGILLYRISRVFFLQNDEKTAAHFSNLLRILCGFEIYYSAAIGKGLKINHGIGTVIGARCIIGENALIHQNVTFGDKNNQRPTLSDNVTVYAGAKVLGGVYCGKNAVIAANCVCFIDVPEGGVVAGIPGVLKK